MTDDCYIYFAFDAEYIDYEKVSRQLQIKPTSVIIKGDRGCKFSSWMYRMTSESMYDLETPLNKLLDVFDKRKEKIISLKEEFELETRLQFVINIDCNDSMSIPYFGFNKRVVKFLGETETEVDFDLYKFDSREG